MAVGDLIVRDGQYEFRNILFNNSPAKPLRMITKIEGLFGVEMRTNDFENLADHGGWAGTDLLPSKSLVIELKILEATKSQIYQTIDSIIGAWQPSDQEHEFVFQKEGLGKRFLWTRPRRFSVPTSYELDNGLAECVLELFAADPRAYQMAEQSAQVTLGAGVASSTVGVNNAGTFGGGTWPVFEIVGPTTNPRITDNVTGRVLRLDGVVPTGEVLRIDTKKRTVTKQGVDVFSWVRNDNQWFSLTPGAHTITYSRSVTSGTSTLTAKWRGAWL